VHSKSGMKNRARWGKRLAMSVPVAGLAAAAVALAGFPGQAHASTEGGMRLAALSTAERSSVAPHCPTTNLRIDFGKPTRTKIAYQRRVQVTLVNRGHSTCSMDGYPGMDLVGDGGQMRLPVAREPERHGTVLLRPGQHASFALTYMLETPREIQGELGAWGPNSVVVTSPNSVSHQSLPWRLGPVYWVSVETGRGTYLSPVGR
jgi:hypothetical protein